MREEQSKPLLGDTPNYGSVEVDKTSLVKNKFFTPISDEGFNVVILSYIDRLSKEFLNVRLVSSSLRDLLQADFEQLHNKISFLRKLFELDWIDHPLCVRQGIKKAKLPALTESLNLHLVRRKEAASVVDFLQYHDLLGEKAFVLLRTHDFSTNYCLVVSFAIIFTLVVAFCALLNINASDVLFKGDVSVLDCNDVVNLVFRRCADHSSGGNCYNINNTNTVLSWIESNKAKLNTTDSLQALCNSLSSYCGSIFKSFSHKEGKFNAQLGADIACSSPVVSIVLIAVIAGAGLFSVLLLTYCCVFKNKSGKGLANKLNCLFQPARPTTATDTRIVEVNLI